MMRLAHFVIIGFLFFTLQISYGEHQQRRSLESHGFPYPLLNSLANAGIHSIEDFAELSEVQVSRFEGIGPVYLKYIKERLAEFGVSFGPRMNSSIPMTDQSIELLNLPLPLRDSLRIRGLQQIGQLILLNETDLKRVTKSATIEKIREELNSLGLSLNTSLPQYDVGIEFAFPRRIAPVLQESGFRTLRELSVFSLEECRGLAVSRLKQKPCSLVLEILQAKGVKLADFPFMDLSLSDRIALYRRGVRSEEAAKEFLRNFTYLPVAQRLASKHESLCLNLFEREPVLQDETR